MTSMPLCRNPYAASCPCHAVSFFPTFWRPPPWAAPKNKTTLSFKPKSSGPARNRCPKLWRANIIQWHCCVENPIRSSVHVAHAKGDTNMQKKHNYVHYIAFHCIALRHVTFQYIEIHCHIYIYYIHLYSLFRSITLKETLRHAKPRNTLQTKLNITLQWTSHH